MIRQHPLNNWRLSLPCLSVMYVGGRGEGKFQFLKKKHHWVIFIRFVLYKGLL